MAIVDDISRGQASEEGRVSPSTHGEFVEVTSKKSQKERQRKEKEEQKRQEEERRRDESKKKRKQGGPPRAGSAGSGSERTQHQSSNSGSKPYSSWMMNPPSTSAPIVNEEELWDVDETLHSHLPAVSAAPGAQLKHPPTTHTTSQQPPPTQAPPQATPIQSQPQAASSSSMWPVDTAKPGVPHTAELVTSDYTLFGSVGILGNAVDSSLPIASAMATPDAMSVQQQGPTSGVASGGQKETTISGEKKREGWQPQAKPNEQESPHDQEESGKSLPKPPRGRGSGGTKNLPPRLKQETSGPGRGRGVRSSGRGPAERKGPGRDKSASQESSVGEKKTALTTATTAELPLDKDKVHIHIHVLSVYYTLQGKYTCYKTSH